MVSIKAVFAHDHIFYKNDNMYYSNGGLSKSVLSRYTKHFTKLEVISRQQSIEDTSGLTIASAENIDFIRVPNFKSLVGLRNYTSAVKIIHSTVKDADLVIARMPSSIAVIAIHAAIKYNKPYLIEVVGCVWDSSVNHGRFLGKIIAPFEFNRMKKLILKSKYNIYITKRFLQKRYPSSAVAKNAICPNVMIGIVDRDVLEKRLQKISGKNNFLRVGLVGSLNVSYKGHDTLLRALSIIKNGKSKVDFSVEFLGKGDPLNWMPLINSLNLVNNVSFIGSLPSGSSVYQWMDNIDIIVQPSKAEAQGRSIIEAMSRGCPIIASNVGGIPELINEKFLINASDCEDLAKKIHDLWFDKNQMMIEASNNFQEAKSYYSEVVEKSREDFLAEFKKDFEESMK